jgi:excisionase family DNA binding protein
MSAQFMTDERIYTVKEAAEKLRVDARTIRRMIAANEISAFRVRGEYRIMQSDIDAVIQRGKEKK